MLFSVNKYVAESSRSEKDKMWGSDWSDLIAGGLMLGPEGHAGFRLSGGWDFPGRTTTWKTAGKGKGARLLVQGGDLPAWRQLTSCRER